MIKILFIELSVCQYLMLNDQVILLFGQSFITFTKLILDNLNSGR